MLLNSRLFRMDVEICTCAGRKPGKHSCEHTCTSLHRLTKHSTPRSQCHNEAHSCQTWHTTVTTLARSFVGDALPTVISSRAHRLQTFRQRPFVSEPKWKEAPYSPPNIERHDACAFHGRGLADKATINGEPYSSLLCYRLFIGTGLTSA